MFDSYSGIDDKDPFELVNLSVGNEAYQDENLIVSNSGFVFFPIYGLNQIFN